VRSASHLAHRAACVLAEVTIGATDALYLVCEASVGRGTGAGVSALCGASRSSEQVFGAVECSGLDGAHQQERAAGGALGIDTLNAAGNQREHVLLGFGGLA
jgi:hypothetical protein